MVKLGQLTFFEQLGFILPAILLPGSQVLSDEWGMQWTLPVATSGVANQKLTVEIWDAVSVLKKGRATFPLDKLVCNKKTRIGVPFEVQPEGSFKWVLPSPPWKLHLVLQALNCGSTNLVMEHAPRIVAEVVQAAALPPLKNPVVRLRYGDQAAIPTLPYPSRRPQSPPVSLPPVLNRGYPVAVWALKAGGAVP